MILHVKEARYLHDYVIWIRFNDGAEGQIDLSNELSGEVFEPLRDMDKFRSFNVDSILETIIWENGADFAPGIPVRKHKDCGLTKDSITLASWVTSGSDAVLE